MNIHPFEWRHLPLLYQYRNQGVFLDNTLALTRGQILVPAGALLSWLGSATGVFTYLGEDENEGSQPLIVQAIHQTGATSAHLSFIASPEALECTDLVALIDQMAVEIGKRGGLYILAEVDEEDSMFEVLRKAGFSIYARQHIWQMPNPSQAVKSSSQDWKAAQRRDEAAIRFLYSALIPGLVQQVEPPPSGRMQGLVSYQENQLLAFIELRYGLAGVLAQPFVHPDAEGVLGKLARLLQNLTRRYSRPVFVNVRSYQSWLEATILNTGATLCSRQAVMMRHLVISRRVTQAYTLPAMNGKRAEPTVPIAQIKKET
jgi:hypothetical protein